MQNDKVQYLMFNKEKNYISFDFFTNNKENNMEFGTYYVNIIIFMNCFFFIIIFYLF